MSPLRITARVGSDGTVMMSTSTGAQCNPRGRVELTGLDGRVIRLFERWLTVRDRSWDEEELRTFGQLLHALLFPGDCWDWLERQAAKGDGDVVQLLLAFPSDRASSRLASLPWEYLCTPDRPGRAGRFLALEPRLVLSRVVPSGTLDVVEEPGSQVRILPVVGDAANPRLGRVDYDDVLGAITRVQDRPGFTALEPLLEVTAPTLRAAMTGPEDRRPHVVHFMGHGRFRDGQGAVALRDPDGGTDWVDESRLAQLLCSDDWSPALVVLHACEGGAVDFAEHFAGLAPALVRAGALCVVAMQYAVTNSTAVAFSVALYAALERGQSLDRAVHLARRSVWEGTADPRLLGIPMVYQRASGPLFALAETEE